MTDLIISNLEIPFDSEGRMSLNALHKASGNEERHRPNYWLELKSTKELISIYRSRNSGIDPVSVKKGGNGQGTFAIEELAFDYAYWISVQFKVQVCEDVKAYRRGEVKTGISVLTHFQNQLLLIETAARMLKISDSGKINMLKKACDIDRVSSASLPNYSESEDNRPAKAATHNLNEIGSEIKTVKFNRLLMEEGLLEELQRPSSNGKTKKYKSITKKGLKFGKNVPNPQNERETQPLWYCDTFKELYNLAIGG